MAKFDLYRSKDGTVLLDCQSDLLDHLNTRLVVPLAFPDDAVQVDRRLNPVLDAHGDEMLMLTHFAAAIPVKQLGARIGSVAEQEWSISAALDVLISGF